MTARPRLSFERTESISFYQWIGACFWEVVSERGLNLVRDYPHNL